jgi:hypothetical protein
MKRSIAYFMWGYQQHFRVTLESHAERVLKELAPDSKPEALLVGVHVSEGKGFDVCVEPEDGKWPLDLFNDLKIRIDELYAAHPRQGMLHPRPHHGAHAWPNARGCGPRRGPGANECL